MRQGLFELLITGKDGTAIIEHEIAGKSYISAEPATEYKVKVVVHHRSNQTPYSLKLYIDGVDVRYSKNMLNKSTIFKGLRSNAKSYRAFVFEIPAPIPQNSNMAAQAGTIGSIKVEINEAIATKKKKNLSQGGFQAVELPKAGQSEGKKFWQQPTLLTGRGSYAGEVSRSKYDFQNLRTVPDATLELLYHTPEMIAFLKDFHRTQAGQVPPAVLPPVHVDLSHVVDAPVAAVIAPVIVDLIENGVKMNVKVKLETQGRFGGPKKARTSPSCSEIIDLTI